MFPKLQRSSMPTTFRSYQDTDLPILKAIMVDAFDGVSIDQGIEREFGIINARNWQWRKARHLDDDVCRDREGIIVAEHDGRIVGFISTWIDREAGIGHIPNLSIVPEWRGKGLGRLLLQMAKTRFREAALTHAKIETLQQNQVGNHLYRSEGFRPVAQQTHFVAELLDDDFVGVQKPGRK